MLNLKYIPNENIFNKFSAHREALIEQFKKGDLSKKEFIEESYGYISRMKLKAYKNVDSFEKAIFNYQYFNMMAKYSYLQSKEMKQNDKHEEIVRDLINKVNYFYRKKDHNTLKAIELLNFINVEAYYIKVSSPNLKENLFEVIFNDYPQIILHSRNPGLVIRLREERVFKEGVRKSLIDNYINEKY